MSQEKGNWQVKEEGKEGIKASLQGKVNGMAGVGGIGGRKNIYIKKIGDENFEVNLKENVKNDHEKKNNNNKKKIINIPSRFTHLLYFHLFHRISFFSHFLW